MCRPLPAAPMASAIPLIARLFDSVAPLVKMMSLGFAPISAAIWPRAPAALATVESNDAGATWHVASSRISLANKARGVSATNALVKLSGTGEAIDAELRVSSFDAGYGLPTFTLNGTGRVNAGKLAAQMNAITGAGGGVKLGGIKLTGNLSTRNYVAHLDMGPITFAPPRRRAPAARAACLPTPATLPPATAEAPHPLEAVRARAPRAPWV